MKAKGFLTDTYQVSLNVDDFNYTIDRTVEKGGKDEGTSPHGFLLGSIAGCKIIVAKSYLDHNNLPYEKIEVDAESTIHGSKKKETIDITVNLHVIGATLDEKELGYMSRIVQGGCTMANILTAGGKNTVTTKITASNL